MAVYEKTILCIEDQKIEGDELVQAGTEAKVNIVLAKGISAAARAILWRNKIFNCIILDASIPAIHVEDMQNDTDTKIGQMSVRHFALIHAEQARNRLKIPTLGGIGLLRLLIENWQNLKDISLRWVLNSDLYNPHLADELKKHGVFFSKISPKNDLNTLNQIFRKI